MSRLLITREVRIYHTDSGGEVLRAMSDVLADDARFFDASTSTTHRE